MSACALAAEEAGLESIWITDHIAIPPDDAEGSGGRYTDTLTTLAWLAGGTTDINLGSGVLIIPYRPKLPTAKQIATIQELSNERLLLGVGIGWMNAEFNALGLDRHQRGRVSDEYLEFFNDCFNSEVVTANGQDFLFKPRPAKPPILIGGSAPHALERAARYGDGWLPMARSPGQIAEHIPHYEELVARHGRDSSTVSVMSGLPLEEESQCRDLISEYEALGVERLVIGMAYENTDDYLKRLELVARLL